LAPRAFHVYLLEGKPRGANPQTLAATKTNPANVRTTRTLNFHAINFLLFASAILISCGATAPSNPDDESLTIKSDSTLETGWYYILKSNGGIKRTLDRDTTSYFLDSLPIVTANNIIKFNIYTSIYGDIGLSMQLDEAGTRAWSTATRKATGKQLAFVVDDKLLHVASVNSEITGGMTALNRGIYTEQELQDIQKQIEN
jgi:hypothetical protein